MCLILVAWQVHRDYPLVLAANRDEYYRRPTLPLAPWEEAPDILGGRDLEAGGSWLACHRNGRFAAVTNVRQGRPEAAPRSRGALIGNYHKNHTQADEFIKEIEPDSYGGLNLLLGDRERLFYWSNRNGRPPQALKPGIYGLSNHQLETPWPKLLAAKQAFAQALEQLPATEPFFALLANREQSADGELPDTGIPLDKERMLSAIFVSSEDYGTRASTLVLGHRHGGFTLQERSFGPGGSYLGEQRAQASVMSTGV